MCLGCLVAGMGLSYESEKAQEFIKAALDTSDNKGYAPQIYGSNACSAYCNEEHETSYSGA